MRAPRFQAVFAVLLAVACRVEIGPPGGAPASTDAEGPSGEVWVYTSMYQPVLDDLDPVIARALPGVTVRWFQAGSEKVAQRFEAEIAAGGSRACLLMTSDPFWYADLHARGLLRPHLTPNVLHLDRGLVNPDGAWAPARLSLVVLARHGSRVPEADAPRSFADLTSPAWGARATMGDPLSSGTMFTTLAFLADNPGWESLTAWRESGLVAAGGNASVLHRIESGERDVGAVLLENVLMARRTGSPVEAIYPEDGAIVVPGPIALTAGCPSPDAARAVYDVILSREGQERMVAGQMYAALPGLPPPEGARPLAEVPTRPWEGAWFDRTVAERDALKERWSALLGGG